jgi:hypothetical protein
MARKTVSEGFSATDVCGAIGLPRTSFDAWLLRRYIPLAPGPGTGRARSLTLLDAIRIGVMAQLTRLGVSAGAAGKAARVIEARMLKAPRSGGRWTMIVGPARSEESTNVGQVLIGQFKGLADAEHAARVRLSDPMAFVMVDISAITERITAALENDDGQTEAA